MIYRSLLLAALLFQLSGMVAPLPAQESSNRAEVTLGTIPMGYWFHVAPGGRVWLPAESGRLYYSDTLSSGLRRSGMPVHGQRMPARVAFFNRDIGIATSLSGAESPVPRPWLYRTTDRGTTWEPIMARWGGITSDPEVHPDGRAWCTAWNSGLILHSTDFGATWDPIRIDSAGAPRVATAVHMIDRKRGVADFRNPGYLRYTENNWRTTRNIQLPLQGAPFTALPRHQEIRPEWPPGMTTDLLFVHREHLFLQSDGAIFATRLDATRLDAVHWHQLRLRKIALDREKGKIYGIDDSLRVVEIDGALRSVPADGWRLRNIPLAMKCREGKIYVVDNQYAIYQIIPGKEFRMERAVTDESPIRRVDKIRRFGRELWGMTLRHLYNSADSGRSWKMVGSSDVPIEGYLHHDRDRVVVWGWNGYTFMFNRQDGSFHEIPELVPMYVTGVMAWPDAWVAYGGPQRDHVSYEDWILQGSPTYDGRPRKSRRAAIAISRDRGATWQPVPLTSGSDTLPPIQRIARLGDDLYLVHADWIIRKVPGALGSSPGLAAEAGRLGENVAATLRHGFLESVYMPRDGETWLAGWGNILVNPEDAGDRPDLPLPESESRFGPFLFRAMAEKWDTHDYGFFPYRELIPYGEEYLARSDSALVRLGRDGSTFPLFDLRRDMPDSGAIVRWVSVDSEGDIILQAGRRRTWQSAWSAPEGLPEDRIFLYQRNTGRWMRLGE